jgi:O-acetyl-ADP-ribose deacetylase (regulator of RNase III)
MERADAAEANAKANASAAAVAEALTAAESLNCHTIAFPRPVAYHLTHGNAYWVSGEVTRMLTAGLGWELHGTPMAVGNGIAQALVRYAPQEAAQ